MKAGLFLFLLFASSGLASAISAAEYKTWYGISFSYWDVFGFGIEMATVGRPTGGELSIELGFLTNFDSVPAYLASSGSRESQTGGRWYNHPEFFAAGHGGGLLFDFVTVDGCLGFVLTNRTYLVKSEGVGVYWENGRYNGIQLLYGAEVGFRITNRIILRAGWEKWRGLKLSMIIGPKL